MQVTLDIPDALACQLRAAGKNPARAALEAVLVEGYRTGQLYEGEIKRILGYGTRMEVHALLKEHNVPINFTQKTSSRTAKPCAGSTNIRQPKPHDCCR